MKKDIVLIGGGGHCKSCIEVIESTNEYNIVGIVDLKEKLGTEILNYKVIASDDDLEDLRNKYEYALLTIGQLKSNGARVKIFNKLKELNFNLPVIKASTAFVAASAKIEEGAIIMHQAFVNADARIGANTIINNRALIEHDCSIGKHCHISTNATLNGSVNIGDNCFIASNACVINNVDIRSNVSVGASSTVLRDITEAGTYIGSPAKKING